MVAKNSDDDKNINRYKANLRNYVWDGRIKSGTLPLVACRSQKLDYNLIKLCVNTLTLFF